MLSPESYESVIEWIWESPFPLIPRHSLWILQDGEDDGRDGEEGEEEQEKENKTLRSNDNCLGPIFQSANGLRHLAAKRAGSLAKTLPEPGFENMHLSLEETMRNTNFARLNGDHLEKVAKTANEHRI